MLGQIPLFPGDPILNESQVHERLDRIVDKIRSCITGAFGIMNGTASSTPMFATALDYKGTRPMVMSGLVFAHIHKEFAGVPDVEIRNVNGFVELRVDGVIDLRFKLVDKAGRTQNMDTLAQKQYRNLLPLDGVGKLDVMRLTVGWRWDAAATRLEDIQIVFLKGDDPVWKYSVLDAEEATQVLRLPKDEDETPPTRYTSTTQRATSAKKGG
ncbi:MAG: hypothetical protein JSU63_07960 [Phycisphaerales bacterium]|nr:MAG: hypothetical protein JSU63_07960 [Phycisphaerales bacterium]